MTIKEGYNGKETNIRIDSRDNGTIELWIEHTGMDGKNETLCYMTLEELHKLFLEVRTAGRDLFC